MIFFPFTKRIKMLRGLSDKGFIIDSQSHASAILERDFPGALEDLERALISVTVPITEIIGSGGGEGKGTQRMRRSLAELGWQKTKFEIKKIVNGVERQSISHEIDHVKQFENGVLALEIEWNNKDPFFDRDLENFKRLHSEGAISVGVIVTRSASLHQSMREFVLRFAHEQQINSYDDLNKIGITPTRPQRKAIDNKMARRRDPLDFPTAWAEKFVSDKYGQATTHWQKLQDRVARGVGIPCPLLLIGLPASIVSFDETNNPAQIAAAIERAALENPAEDSDP
jgi:Restriction endonuclease BglII